MHVEAPSNLMAEESRLADTELVERCLRGDLGAFEELYRQHSTRLYNLAFRMVGNAADTIGLTIAITADRGQVGVHPRANGRIKPRAAVFGAKNDVEYDLA